MTSGQKLLAGCGIAAACAAAGLTLLIVLNWSRLAGMYRKAADSVKDVTQVQAQLQNRYTGSEDRVQVHWRSSVPGSILSVTLSNPPFFEQVESDAAAARTRALEVAQAARAALPPGTRYENYEVVFARSRGTIVRLATTVPVLLTAGELPDPPPAP